MELRQLRYFVTLAEELHFGRAAAREHIVQSALSQQIRRLERDIGARLFERSTHHVRLTPAGAALLLEARQILAHAEQAGRAARHAASAGPALRIGLADAGYSWVPRVVQAVRRTHPELDIHELVAGVERQYALLADGRLDVGFGRVLVDPPGTASEVFRLDPLGVLLAERHPLATRVTVPMPCLAEELVSLAEDRAPELNQFVLDLCLAAGFTPRLHRARLHTPTTAVELVARGQCVVCVPESGRPAAPGVVWRRLVEPASRYPWSVLWRAGDASEPVRAVVAAAERLSREHGWLAEAREAAG